MAVSRLSMASVSPAGDHASFALTIVRLNIGLCLFGVAAILEAIFG